MSNPKCDHTMAVVRLQEAAAFRKSMRSSKSMSQLMVGSSDPDRSRESSMSMAGINKLSYSQIHGSVQILSVDDEEINQIVVEEILTSSGYVYAK
jgi:CheY-like chemotaxis protein